MIRRNGNRHEFHVLITLLEGLDSTLSETIEQGPASCFSIFTLLFEINKLSFKLIRCLSPATNGQAEQTMLGEGSLDTIELYALKVTVDARDGVGKLLYG